MIKPLIAAFLVIILHLPLAAGEKKNTESDSGALADRLMRLEEKVERLMKLVEKVLEQSGKAASRWNLETLEPQCSACGGVLTHECGECPHCKKKIIWTGFPDAKSPTLAIQRLQYAYKYKDADALEKCFTREAWKKNGSSFIENMHTGKAKELLSGKVVGVGIRGNEAAVFVEYSKFKGAEENKLTDTVVLKRESGRWLITLKRKWEPAQEAAPEKQVKTKAPSDSKPDKSCETAAAASLRILIQAQAMYRVRFGAFADTLERLAEIKIIDKELAAGKKKGYTFSLTGVTENKFQFRAIPEKDGLRSFFIDESGRMRESDTKDIGPESKICE
jgi:predicted Zn-ribbon and HTH transcriptional regulator